VAGYHLHDAVGPYAMFTLTAAGNSVAQIFLDGSHELAELLVDASANRFINGWYAEVADPVVCCHYDIELSDGSVQPANDFVLPHWFVKAAAGPYDFIRSNIPWKSARTASSSTIKSSNRKADLDSQRNDYSEVEAPLSFPYLAFRALCLFSNLDQFDRRSVRVITAHEALLAPIFDVEHDGFGPEFDALASKLLVIFDQCTGTQGKPAQPGMP
jgi:hypothetical protein